mgnify:CR=1 FL=1
MDNFSAGTNDINRIYVDGLSITHGANATNGAGSGRSHIYTIHVDGNNTGGNNGGSTPGVGNGGSGVVILRTPTAGFSSVTVTGSPTSSTSGSDTIHVFTGTGSIRYNS